MVLNSLIRVLSEQSDRTCQRGAAFSVSPQSAKHHKVAAVAECKTPPLAKDKVARYLILFALVVPISVGGGCSCNPVGPELPDRRNISNSEGNSSSPAIAVDPQGNVHVAWTEEVSGNEEIFYASRSADGTWAGPFNMFKNEWGSRYPAIAADARGNIHIAWQDDSGGRWQTLYVVKSRGYWSIPDTILCTGMSTCPSLAVDGAENVHLVWNEFLGNEEVFYSMKTRDGSWSQPFNLSHSDPWSVDPCIGVDGQGNVHVVWSEWYDYPGTAQILYATKPPGGDWTSAANISHSEEDADWPWLAVDVQGSVHVVWQDDREIVGGFCRAQIYYATRSLAGAWSDPVNISRSGRATRSCLAMDSRGGGHLVWSEGGVDEIRYSSRSADGSWSESAVIGTFSGFEAHPRVAADEEGGVHIVWQDGEFQDWDIYYVCYQP